MEETLFPNRHSDGGSFILERGGWGPGPGVQLRVLSGCCPVLLENAFVTFLETACLNTEQGVRPWDTVYLEPATLNSIRTKDC